MIPVITECLRSVSHPRFFETERGYQGAFLTELKMRLPRIAVPGDAIVEQEYQKRFSLHGINVRPDIIIHVPTASDHGDRRKGNFVVFELNLHAGAAEAQGDFSNLDAVLTKLDYPLAVFVNIATGSTQAAQYTGTFKSRIHCFAVRQSQGTIDVIHGYFRGGSVIEEKPGRLTTG